MWHALAIGLPVLLTLLPRLPTVDLAYHLRIGSLIGAEHVIPRVDTVTFGADGRTWVDQQWAAQVFLSMVHDVGGFAGLVVFGALLVAAMVLGIFAACRARGASPRAACVLTVAAYITAMQSTALRPQLFGAVLFSGSVYLVSVRREHPWVMWLIPPVTALWSNVHGSFVLAVGVVAFAWLEDLVQDRGGWRKGSILLLLTIFATLVNPYGASVWTYAASLGSNPMIRNNVEEWHPPTLESVGGACFLIGLVALAGLLARRGKTLSWLDLVWLGGYSVLALVALRNVLWWAIAVAPVVASLVPRRGSASTPPRGAWVVHTAVLVLVGSALIAALPWVRPTRPLVDGVPSAGLMESVERHLQPNTRLFVYQPWASWVEFTEPEVDVFVDSRIEIFPPEVWREYQYVIDGAHGWDAILEEWAVEAVMISPEQKALARGLSENERWTLVHEDNEGSLFIRR